MTNLINKITKLAMVPILAGSLAGCEREIKEPFCKSYKDSKWANFSIFGNVIYGDSKGINFAVGGNVIYENSKGADISVIFNYSKSVKDFLIQYGTLGNVIKEVPEDAFVLQVGVWNQAGDQYCPIINIKGTKNLPRIIKNAFKKKSLEEKIKNLKDFAKEEFEEFIKLKEKEGFKYMGNSSEIKEFMEKHYKNLPAIEEDKQIIKQNRMEVLGGNFSYFYISLN